MSMLSIGIAGIGNVGSELFKQLIKSQYYNKKFVIGGISFKSKSKKRNINLKKIKFCFVFGTVYALYIL